jgi:para-nitrobenzyl esterase
MKSSMARFESLLRASVRLLSVPALVGGLSTGCADVAEGDEAVAESVASLRAERGPDLQVRVKQGELRGKLVENTRAFLGIPYAKPPVGERRFAPAQPAERWRGVRDAVAFGASCPQPPGALAAPGPQSEDCLFLNVYTPAQPIRKKLPVMVFIHGGAFVAGSSVQYDGRRLSEEGGVVVVTINYRLGALGFLAHPALDEERCGDEPSGNDALRDQQLALAWVQKNIDEFGGNPKEVTVFGESAGSMSACLQMVAPHAKKYADRYIMESGTCVAGLPISSKAQAQTLGKELADTLCAGADDVVSCLRAKPASELIAFGASRGISGAGWAPVINPDDEFLPEHPSKLIAAGDYNRRAEVIVGSNAREWGLFQAIGQSPRPATVAQLHAILDGQFGPLAPALKLAYPASDATANLAYVNLMTDYLFRCPARELARQVGARGTTAYLYSFEEGAAFHAFELPYVFGNPNPTLGAPVLVEPLRETMQTYWTTFAHEGDPNAAGQPVWPEYDAQSDQHMTLKATSAVGSGLTKPQCDLWASIPRQ